MYSICNFVLFKANYNIFSGYIQISQVPSRNEPDSDGEINYPFIFHQIAKLGYKGWIGCEYHPRGTSTLQMKKKQVFFIKETLAEQQS